MREDENWHVRFVVLLIEMFGGKRAGVCELVERICSSRRYSAHHDCRMGEAAFDRSIATAVCVC